MCLEIIPPGEISVYLNQVDLFSLILINKKMYCLYKSYLDGIKRFSSQRANILSIAISFNETTSIAYMNHRHNEKIIEYSCHLNLHIPNIENLKVIVKLLEYIKDKCTQKIILESGDIIRVQLLNDSYNANNFLILNDYHTREFQKYITYSDKLLPFCNLNISKVDLHRATLPLYPFPPTFWFSGMTFYSYLVPISKIILNEKINEYVEILYDKFRYRINICPSPIPGFVNKNIDTSVYLEFTKMNCYPLVYSIYGNTRRKL